MILGVTSCKGRPLILVGHENSHRCNSSVIFFVELGLQNHTDPVTELPADNVEASKNA